METLGIAIIVVTSLWRMCVLLEILAITNFFRCSLNGLRYSPAAVWSTRPFHGGRGQVVLQTVQ